MDSFLWKLSADSVACIA